MTLKSQRLAGDVAIVTGAASGIDRGIALELALNGASVACVDINDKSNEETIREITKQGGDAFPVHMDVGDSASVKQGMKYAYDKMGKVTILVNGAGLNRFSPIETCSDAEWQEVLRVELDRLLLLFERDLPLYEGQRRRKNRAALILVGKKREQSRWPTLHGC